MFGTRLGTRVGTRQFGVVTQYWYFWDSLGTRLGHVWGHVLGHVQAVVAQFWHLWDTLGTRLGHAWGHVLGHDTGCCHTILTLLGDVWGHTWDTFGTLFTGETLWENFLGSRIESYQTKLNRTGCHPPFALHCVLHKIMITKDFEHSETCTLNSFSLTKQNRKRPPCWSSWQAGARRWGASGLPSPRARAILGHRGCCDLSLVGGRETAR
jgi:hypothetical protein